MSLKKNTLSFLLITGLSVGISATAFAECKLPSRPFIPDGKTTTKKELTDAIKYFKGVFQPSIGAFQHCVDEEKAMVGDVATDAQIAKWQEQQAVVLKMEEELVAIINQSIRDFKARQSPAEAPKPAE